MRVEIGNEEAEKPPTAAAPAAPLPQTIRFNGLIQRSDGKNTVWLNNKPVTESTSGGLNISTSRNDPRLKLQVPESGRSMDLKVGQSAEIVSGTIEDNYLRRRPVKSDAKGPADAEKAQPDVQKVTSGGTRDAVGLGGHQDTEGGREQPGRLGDDRRGQHPAQEAADRAWVAKKTCEPEFGAWVETRAQDQEGFSGEGSLAWSDDVFYSNLEGPEEYRYDVEINKFHDGIVEVHLSGRFWSDEDIGDPSMSQDDADQFNADLKEMLQRAADGAWVRMVPDGAED